MQIFLKIHKTAYEILIYYFFNLTILNNEQLLRFRYTASILKSK